MRAVVAEAAEVQAVAVAATEAAAVAAAAAANRRFSYFEMTTMGADNDDNEDEVDSEGEGATTDDTSALSSALRDWIPLSPACSESSCSCCLAAVSFSNRARCRIARLASISADAITKPTDGFACGDGFADNAAAETDADDDDDDNEGKDTADDDDDDSDGGDDGK